MSAAIRAVEPPIGTPLRGRRLRVARAAWVAAAVLNLVLFLLSIPIRNDQLLALSHLPPEVTSADARVGLAAVGLSAEAYAAVYLATNLALALVSVGVGALIFWRRSDDGMALFVSFILLTLGASADTEALAAIDPALGAFGVSLGNLTWTSLMIFFYVFPDGRFAPRWTRWLLVPLTILTVGGILLPASPFDLGAWPPVLVFLFLTGVFGGGACAQIYRYRRLSSPMQRQQTKWVVFGFTAPLMLFMVMRASTLAVPALAQPGPAKAVYELAFLLIFFTFATCLPLSVGVAILRYRLYDIDLLINRTLVYSALTGALVAVYFGGVALLQGLFRALVGQESELAVVAATLTVAASFQPLRARVQGFIDRRFFRRRYDAARVLAAHGVSLRDDADLEAVSAALVRVADETMRPAHASLWLRETNARE